MEFIEWLDDKLRILDQTRLPLEEVYLELSTYQEVAQVIKEMKVRGAPMIGVAAAYGLALGAQTIQASDKAKFLAELQHVAEALVSTRPTAVNLFQAIERMQAAAQAQDDIPNIRASLANEARAIHEREEQATRQISQ